MLDVLVDIEYEHEGAVQPRGGQEVPHVVPRVEVQQQALVVQLPE